MWILGNPTNFYGFVLVFCFLFRKIKFTSFVPIICLALCWVLYIHYFRLMRISIFAIMKNEPFTSKETCHQPQLVNSRAWIWGERQLAPGSCSLGHLSRREYRDQKPRRFFPLCNFSGLFMQLLILRN